MLARDGGSQKVSFHKLPSQAASPLTSLATGQSVNMPEAVYSVYFETQVRPSFSAGCWALWWWWWGGGRGG